LPSAPSQLPPAVAAASRPGFCPNHCSQCPPSSDTTTPHSPPGGRLGGPPSHHCCCCCLGHCYFDYLPGCLPHHRRRHCCSC
jgi:hypothetical protein